MGERLFHIVTRGIEGRPLFLEMNDYRHFTELMVYYKYNPNLSFSDYREIKKTKRFNLMKDAQPLVEIIAYVLMPNHIHVVLEELSTGGIVTYSKRVFNSYTRYFNEKRNRKGTLYQSSIKKFPIKSEEYLLHLTRYLHLNPCSAGLVKNPEDWEYSSYREYIGLCDRKICFKEKHLDISPKEYVQFVKERKDYQRTLEILKGELDKWGK